MTNKINHNELKEFLKVCYNSKTPSFIWGGVGVGKSQVIKETAKEIAKSLDLEFTENSNEKNKFGFVDVRISQLEPSDLRGLPTVDLNTNTTRWLFPNWLPHEKDSCGILFFDELNLSPPSIQAVAYQLILDRKVGDYELPSGWVIVSAGNRAEDRCNVFDMSQALGNRFLHAELITPSIESWTKWAIDNGVDSRIVAFMNFKPNSLYRIDDKSKDKAFPTPRSWAFCSRIISGLKEGKFTEQLVASAVGEGTGREFSAFLRLQNKINIEELLKEPKLIANIKEVDLKYVLLGTIAEKYKANKKLFEKILPLCNHLEAEYSILLLRFLKAVDEKLFIKEIKDSKLGIELLKNYGEILT